jgi:hypothetical protein
MKFHILRTDYDIGQIYSYGIVEHKPFVSGTKVHLDRLLHIRNFWQRHLTNPDEDTYYKAFQKLAGGQRPKAWDRPLSEGGGLKSSWLGFYCKREPNPLMAWHIKMLFSTDRFANINDKKACIHPYPKALKYLETRQTCADLDGHWTETNPLVRFQSLHFLLSHAMRHTRDM